MISYLWMRGFLETAQPLRSESDLTRTVLATVDWVKLSDRSEVVAFQIGKKTTAPRFRAREREPTCRALPQPPAGCPYRGYPDDMAPSTDPYRRPRLAGPRAPASPRC